MNRFFLFLALSLLWLSCETSRATLSNSTISDDGQIDFQLLHINDVYEIAPIEGGKSGGMARVATVRKELLAQNKNTLTVHSGDFLNPSLIGTLRYEGSRIRGRQMVEVMNALGVDVVAFGNHEFDVEENELQARLNESNFQWLGTNVLHVKKTFAGELVLEPFYKLKNGKPEFVPETWIWTIQDADGTQLKVGFLSATIPSNPRNFVFYEDAYQEAVKAYLALAPQVDIVVGLTHQELIQDMKLASLLPNVPLIMGGHEHENSLDTIGTVVIAKADANVKTAWVHRFHYDKKTKSLELNLELIPITDKIQEEPTVAAIVSKWTSILHKEVAQIIEHPNEVIFTATTPLDGREASVRTRQTNFGQLIAASMFAAAKQPTDAAILNGGSIRLDDQLRGTITAMDIFRALPFGGDIQEVELTGELLQQLLDAGVKNRGIGGYLQLHNIQYDETQKSWLIKNEPLKTEKSYRIILPGFLLTGLESNMSFFTPQNPGILSIDKAAEGDTTDIRADIRKAVIAYMKQQ